MTMIKYMDTVSLSSKPRIVWYVDVTNDHFLGTPVEKDSHNKAVCLQPPTVANEAQGLQGKD